MDAALDGQVQQTLTRWRICLLWGSFSTSNLEFSRLSWPGQSSCSITPEGRVDAPYKSHVRENKSRPCKCHFCGCDLQAVESRIICAGFRGGNRERTINLHECIHKRRFRASINREKFSGALRNTLRREIAEGDNHSIRALGKKVRQTQNSLCGAQIETETLVAGRSRQTGSQRACPVSDTRRFANSVLRNAKGCPATQAESATTAPDGQF